MTAWKTPPRPEWTPPPTNEYLEQLAARYPARDDHGYVIGFYVYSGYSIAQKRETDAFPTSAEAQEWADRVVDGHVVCGHVFTAKGKIIHAPHPQPTPARPLRPYRILRGREDLPEARIAIYFKTKAARDAGAKRWAMRDGAYVFTELWDAEVASHGDVNRGWVCDDRIEPDTEES